MVDFFPLLYYNTINKSSEGCKMAAITIQQPAHEEQTPSICVVCGTMTFQQREGVMYECEHCLNEHED